MICANLFYLIYASLNAGSLLNRTQEFLSTASSLSFDDSGHRHGSKRPILRRRQLPGTVQTVTATVTLTVTNNVVPSTSPAGLPATSTVALPLATNSLSETLSPQAPIFVTATSEGLSPSTLPPNSLASSVISSSAALPTAFDPSSSTSSIIDLVPTSTLFPPDNPSSTSDSSSQSNPLASTNPSSRSNSSGQANSSDSAREESEDTRGLNRLLVPFIVISVVCTLGLVAGFLFYLSPYMKEARLRQHARSGSIFEDYSASARTFEPNPTGALNYQRSLSRKRNRRAHLVEASGLPTKIPRPKTKSLDGGLWLPQTSAGPGLTRPA